MHNKNGVYTTEETTFPHAVSLKFIRTYGTTHLANNGNKT